MLTVIAPSRGRPHNVAALLEAWHATTTGFADLVVAVDDDDPTLADYHDLTLGRGVTMTTGPRLRLGGTLNALAPRYAAQDHVGFLGDDHRPRTVGWDRLVVEALDATPGAVVYGDDLVQRERLPTAVFLDRRIVATLGYMVPPGMVHLYLDDFWRALGERLGTLRYLPNVVIEHLHPTAGTAESDAGYAEVNSSEMYAADRARFEAYRSGSFDADIAHLVEVLA